MKAAVRKPNQNDQRRIAGATVLTKEIAPLATLTNGEELAHANSWPFQFTKGLPHTDRGFVAPEVYRQFVDAIEACPQFSNTVLQDVPRGPRDVLATDSTFDGAGLQHTFHCTGPGDTPFPVRKWEASHSGNRTSTHVADASRLTLPPAPSVGTDELTAEMAEVYGLALLRDVPFTAIRNFDETPGAAGATPKSVKDALNQMLWFRPQEPVTGIFATKGDPLSENEKTRRAARLQGRSALDGQSLFRSSASGAIVGPYVSQFLLAGTTETPADGIIGYGVHAISHRVAAFEAGLDYMTDWHSWLDAQNGADMGDLQHTKDTDRLAPEDKEPRFLTTPRDLATYMRSDELYQANLNAAIMLSGSTKTSLSLPSEDATDQNDRSGGISHPDLLALLSEVSTRGMKLAQRQKFNQHRRAGPERIAAMLTLVANNDLDGLSASARQDLIRMFGELHQTGLLDQISAHNAQQLKHKGNLVQNRGNLGETSLLLPMAFADGSPMQPSYGSGHATVAGACVTILKGFFQLFKSEDSWAPLTLADVGMQTVFEATEDGTELRDSLDDAATITVEGELNKLAANISLSGSMAGTHYYSDYHDSLRLGERLAVIVLAEYLTASTGPQKLRLHGFDGEQITMQTTAAANDPNPLIEVSGQDYKEWLSVGTHRVQLP